MSICFEGKMKIRIKDCSHLSPYWRGKVGVAISYADGYEVNINGFLIYLARDDFEILSKGGL
jgi:hypothetical protein